LGLLNEAEVLALLKQEQRGANRVTILERLHQRYCSLRASRERMEILGKAARP
jgi:hypothetical protein